MTYLILPATDGVTPYNAERDQHIQQGIADTETLAASGTTLGASALALAGAAYTLAASASYPDLVAAFYTTPASGTYRVIGHRLGGADQYPENSEIGSQSALESQAAVEMSAQWTVDGHGVVMHDSTLDRTTSASGNLSDYSLAQLTSTALVDIGASALGPGWSASQRVPLVGNELRRWENRGVMFLEPKADATRTLRAATGFQSPGNWVVWKFNRGASGALPSHAVNARAAGLPLWVYMTSGDSHSLIDTVLATLTGPNDAIGVDVADSDSNIAYTCTQAAALGVTVIGFVVRLRSERDRLKALGVNAFMGTAPLYLVDDLAQFTVDGFSGAVRRAGEYEGASNKLVTIDGANGVVALSQGTTATLSMGSMCPVPDPGASANGYRISFGMRWNTLPASTEHSDVYFGHTSDEPYAHQATTNKNGYHFVFRGSGSLELFTHTAGVSSGTSLGSAATTAPASGAWMTFQIDVTPTQVIVRRTDVGPTSVTANDTSRRGGYFGLASGSSSQAPQFRDITVAAL